MTLHDLAEGVRAMFMWIGVWTVFADDGPVMQALVCRLQQRKEGSPT